jgi:hypothetical protein
MRFTCANMIAPSRQNMPSLILATFTSLALGLPLRLLNSYVSLFILASSPMFLRVAAPPGVGGAGFDPPIRLVLVSCGYAGMNRI